ncbi:FecR family protein [Flavivirga spongiicola]|uniref:FecR domain-containing protein n=1 Tax=Flavivirga spongiicola TaxID=421621 RepID=A0ABU7XU36_9FLAO|nr:FecR family protein [Flavivirga sp. MEBiC05379]MDO5979081.1 FecR domain-containing protein [Flavivirga sp. MEBiC05379]
MHIDKEYLIKLIDKFQEGKASDDEIRLLVNFYKYCQKTNDWPAEIPNKDLVLKGVLSKVEKGISSSNKNDVKTKYLQFSRILKYAAIIVILIGLGYFYKQGSFSNESINETQEIVDHNIKTGTDKATLTLGDGTEIVLEKNQNYSDKNATSDGEKIIYNAAPLKKPKVKIAYHYLTIPRGGQYYLKLSDGTGVWLNSESQLKYPIHFVEGETRRVELVYGEAYFDVSPSSKHKGANFKVYNSAQEIDVLGTEFNVKAYKDETHIYTTLVEGKVAISANKENQTLAPNQQSDLNIETNSINITVVDVYNEISWKEGLFIFEEKPLKNIMKVLSRWYDMDVIFINKAIEKEEFNGLLRKDQKIEDILSNIKKFGTIKNYRINDKKVIIE